MSHRRSVKSENELFVDPVDNETAQLEFANNMRTSQYKSTIAILRLVMRAYSSMLTYGRHSGYYTGVDYDTSVKNTLKLSEVRLTESEKSSLRSKGPRICFRFVLSIVAIYMVVKYGTLSILRFFHDSLVRKLMQKFEKNVYTVTLSESDISEMELLDQISRWLNYIGNPMKLQYGFAILHYSFACICILIVFLFGHLMLHIYEVKVDSFAFLIDPFGQIKKIQNELDLISSRLVWSLMTENRGVTKSDSHGRKSDKCKYHDVNLRPIFLSLQDRLQLIQLVLNINDRNLVKPANLSASWHWKMTRYLNNGFRMLISTGLVIVFLLNLFAFSGELYLRVNLRLNLIEGRKAGRNVTFLRRVTHLEELSDSAAITAYEQYDGTQTNQISLAVMYELKDNLKHLNNCLTYLELNIFACYAVFWFALFFSIIILGMVDKTQWANQISSQVHHCLVLLASKKRTKLNEHDRDRILRLSTLSYLNYSLFKKEFRKYQTSLSITQSVIQGQTLILLIIAYIVIMNTDSSYSILLTFCAGYVVVLVNVNLLLLTNLMNKMKGVMKDVNNMLSYGVGESNLLLYSMELWRRQLIDDKELNLSYAINILGVQVTPEKLVTVNFYLLTLCYLIYLE